MSRLAVVALAAALSFAPSAPVQAKCAPTLLAPQLLTHPADTIPAGGGVLVGYIHSRDDDAAAARGADPAVNADWKMTVAKRRVAPRIEVLAPGLAVYRPGAIRGARPTALTLRDGKGKKLGAFSARGRAAAFALSAPTVTSATTVTTTVDYGRYQGTKEIATVVVDAIPRGAVALIAYRTSGTTPVAIAWARVEASSKPAIEIYATPGRCGTEPDGLSAPTTGESIVVAWVDQFGQRTSMSAPVRVK